MVIRISVYSAIRVINKGLRRGYGSTRVLVKKKNKYRGEKQFLNHFRFLSRFAK